MKGLDLQGHQAFFSNWKNLANDKEIDNAIEEFSSRLDEIQPLVEGGFFIHDYRTLTCAYASENIVTLTGVSDRSFYKDYSFEKGINYIAPEEFLQILVLQQKAFEYISQLTKEEKRTVSIYYICRRIKEGDPELKWFFCKITPLVFNEQDQIILDYEYIETIPYPYNHGFYWKVSHVDKTGKELFISSDQEDSNKTEDLSIFTKTEKKIVDFLSENYNSKQIAEFMNLSVHTVNTHRKNIRKKIGK